MKTLLIALQASPTDLARLIEHVVSHRRPALWVDQATVTTWQTRAPEAWREASAWLAQRGIPIVVISASGARAEEPLRHAGETPGRVSCLLHCTACPSSPAPPPP